MEQYDFDAVFIDNDFKSQKAMNLKVLLKFLYFTLSKYLYSKHNKICQQTLLAKSFHNMGGFGNVQWSLRKHELIWHNSTTKDWWELCKMSLLALAISNTKFNLILSRKMADVITAVIRN